MTIYEQETLLIESALDGDQAAYKQLYNLHVDALYRFLTQFSETSSQSEEWVQRTFIKAFQKLGSFKKNSTFKTWLFTIGLNEMRTDMRSNVQFTELEEYHMNHVEDNSIEETGLWLKAKEAIRELAPDKKIVCLLHIAENYTHAEIASMIGISEAASRTTLHRAKRELKLIVQQ